MTAPNAKSWVGRSIRRFEDYPLVTGQGSFTADLRPALYARFVRSAVPSGRIEKIIVPKGATVITSTDLVGVKLIQPVIRKHDYVPIGQPLLANQVVRFVGEAVAVVLAPTQEEAEDIADQVEVEITESNAVVTIAGALEAGAPAVHPEAPGNVIVHGRMQRAVSPAGARSLKRVSVNVRSNRQSALPIEPRSAHAAYDRASGRVTLTCTTQSPHLFRTIIADLLGMPEANLRVVAPDVGGGFGQKATLPPEFGVVTWLARRYRTSVAWVEDRRENLTVGYHARDQQISIEGAFDDSGKLVAMSADILVNVGAYSSFPTTFAVEPLMGMAELPGVYDFQDYTCVSRGVVTNTCPMAPYRGVARPVIVFAAERLMDTAAAELGIDPIEIRRRNLISTFPYTSATGLVFDEGTYRETLDMAVKAVNLPVFRARQKQERRKGRFLGIGFATFSERTGYGTPAFAARGMDFTMGWECVEVTMDPAGFVEARIGASPHGQGLRTTLSQIIADELGVTPDHVKIIHGDTDRSPYGWGTFASRSLVISGGASMLASRKVRVKLIRMAGHLLEAAAEDIVLEGGAATVSGTDRSIPIEAIARAAYHQTHLFNGEIEPGLSESATYDPGGTFSNACHAAIVDVDVETGAVKIERYVVMEDAGRLVNPMIVDGQIHGGVAQGIANALLEEIVYDESGQILTTSLADFLPPTVLEIPAIEIGHLETLTPASVTQAKGLGEGGAIGPPAAIINAVNDALAPFGATINEIPATPRRIRAALRSVGA
jgi:carbon-monoxide dehydrogenase large subunit